MDDVTEGLSWCHDYHDKGRFSRTFDTAGEFVQGVKNRGFGLPARTIIPKFRPNDPRREFAGRITFDDPGPAAGTADFVFQDSSSVSNRI
jgi:hypothetical protein